MIRPEQSIKPGTTARILRFAAPYGGMLVLFLAVVGLDAGIGVVNPLLYRDLINNGIMRSDVRAGNSSCRRGFWRDRCRAGTGATWLAP